MEDLALVCPTRPDRSGDRTSPGCARPGRTALARTSPWCSPTRRDRSAIGVALVYPTRRDGSWPIRPTCGKALR